MNFGTFEQMSKCAIDRQLELLREIKLVRKERREGINQFIKEKKNELEN